MDLQQTPRPERITMRTIWQGLLDSFNLERGLIGTTISLTKHPGQAIRAYLLEDRERLIPPFRYLFFMVAIGTFITVQYFNSQDSWIEKFRTDFERGYENAANSNQESQAFIQAYLENTSYLFNNYFNLFILLGVPISSLATLWFFRRSFNYAEHLVINSYITAYHNVIYIVLTPVLLFSDFITLSWIYTFFTLIYTIFAYQKVYQAPGIRGALTSLAAFITYMFIYYILIISIFLTLAFIAMAKS